LNEKKEEKKNRGIQKSKQLIINLILSVCFFQSFKLREDIKDAASHPELLVIIYAQISVQDIKAK